MISEFRDFLDKYNALPAAIGLIMALAFLPIVDAIVNVVMSIIGAIFGADTSFDRLSFNLNDTPIFWGAIFTAILSFLMVAAVVFMIVKALAKHMPEEGPTDDQVLLGEIRDALKTR